MTELNLEQIEILGVWEDLASVPPHNRMELDAAQLAAHWRRCSLTSDFWSRYTACFLPVRVSDERLPRDAVEGVFAYLLNELFENCAKFSAGPLQAVHYRSWMRETETVFQLTNHISPEGLTPFRTVIQEILEGDPDELYFQKLEENVELNRGGSGLGFLTLIKDYGIRFGFRFHPITPETVAVDVQAHVSLKEDN